MSQIKYPIAETFHSIQGEGQWAGTPMFFIRLAGCNVGKYDLHPDPVSTDPLKILSARNPGYSICTSILGQEFQCDTNYAQTEKYSVDELISMVRENHVCITGGEPFLHNLLPLIRGLQFLAMVHIETSGTLPFPAWLEEFRNRDRWEDGVWITCSPKKGFCKINIPLVHEWKFVVGNKISSSQEYLIEDFGRSNPNAPVYVSPVNGIDSINPENVKYVMHLLESHPNWRLTMQLHKILGVR